MKSQNSRTALSKCNLPLLPQQKYVAVVLLTGETLYFIVEVKDRCQNIFEKTCKHIGLNDTELFNLAIKIDNDFIFVEQILKLYKYAPKAWKINSSGLDLLEKPLLIFYFRLQLYVDCHLLLKDNVSRHHYYLQMKENVRNYRIPLSDDRAFLLASYALQADLGNFKSGNKNDYFDENCYFSKKVIKKLGKDYIHLHLPSLHRDNQGMSCKEAEINFLKESSATCSPHNLHFYKMSRKKGKLDDLVWIGISHKSLQVFEDNYHFKSRLAVFPWSSISKINFEKKKFEVRCIGCPEIRKYIYFAKNEELAKSLFWLCRLTHQYSMSVHSKAAELEKKHTTLNSFRENYIYSDTSELNLGSCKTILASPRLSNYLEKSKELQVLAENVSVASIASSGIISDKILSLSESQENVTEPDQELHHFLQPSLDYHLTTQTLNSGNVRTRIGVSSLTKSRNNRVPLSVYKHCEVTGSEPQLNHLRSWSSDYSFDSEHSLPVDLVNNNLSKQKNLDSVEENKNGMGRLLPPPLAYQNDLKGTDILVDANCKDTTELSVKCPPPVSSLQSLSRSMELPFLTALFNDRSLKMLPKTVPTCSRERHLGAAKDVRRFSCSSTMPPFPEYAVPTSGVNSQTWDNRPTHSNLFLPPKSEGKVNYRPHSLSAPTEVYPNFTGY